MKRRGHRVILITSAHFREVTERAGVEFESLDAAGEYERVAANPNLWRPIEGLKVLAAEGSRTLKGAYEAIERLNVPGKTVVVASTLGFGARIAQEKLSIPTVTLHMQPIIVRSVEAPPVGPDGRSIDILPRWMRRLVLWLLDVFLVDRYLGAPVNVFRREKGLPPVKRILKEWMNSPDLVLCMFPDWFAPRRSDWPAQAKLVGFPLYDAADASDAAPGLDEFLDSGPPPVVFTFGTAMHSCREVMAASVEACRDGGFRGVLVTSDLNMVPNVLPPGIKYVPFAPFGRLFARAAAVVHHGGMGTLSQALADGCPQIVVPFAFDQPDNAARVKRLGVGDSIKPAKYRPETVVRMLKELTESESVRASCRAAADRIRNENGLAAAAAAIEELVTPRSASSR
jgi:UDP:flavonoid glycosyltransferase YjiC (YdhE family)